MIQAKAYNIDNLPAEIPLFPLDGVLLLPRGHLPLNIFEPRYIEMVEDALKGSRMIGMVQPQDYDEKDEALSVPLYDIGCAGKITEFVETDDGRFHITLSGICRFRILKELELKNSYRRCKPSWMSFENDLKPEGCIDLDRDRMQTLLESYFDLNSLSCDWEAIEKAPDEKLITCLSMICPLGAREKQALLEADGCARRAEMFMTMLEMAVHDGKETCGGCH